MKQTALLSIALAFVLLILVIVLVVYIASDSNYDRDVLKEYYVKSSPVLVIRFGEQIAKIQQAKFASNKASLECVYQMCMPVDSIKYFINLVKDNRGNTLILLKDSANIFTVKQIIDFEKRFVHEVDEKAKLFALF